MSEGEILFDSGNLRDSEKEARLVLLNKQRKEIDKKLRRYGMCFILSLLGVLAGLLLLPFLHPMLAGGVIVCSFAMTYLAIQRKKELINLEQKIEQEIDKLWR
ncbi:hypothetical protein KJ885_02665 [Patescibacteria group bacterium]|nr:hypothetical protein [Patescibacteria group bacterium]